MKKILFLSNMYPGVNCPEFGTFVKTNKLQLEKIGYAVERVVINEKNTSKLRKIYNYISYISRGLDRILFAKYDFIYVHYLTYSTIPLFIAHFIFRRKVKFCINIHGDDLVGASFMHKFMSVTSSYLLNHAAKVIVPSQYFHEILLSKYSNLDESDVLISYSGGVDHSVFKRKESSLNDKRIFGYLSRVEEGKGWYLLLNAIDDLLKDDTYIDQFEFHFYGSGKQEQLFLKELETRNLTNVVRFFGSVAYEEVPRVINSFDFFVFPTERESLGLVLLESMSCGIPAIASDIKPLRDLLSFNSAMLFSPDSMEDLVSNIKVCLDLDVYEYKCLSDSYHSQSLRYSNVNIVYLLSEFLAEV